MSLIKRLFIVLLVVILLLVVALAAAPYFFKEELVALAKTEINKNINAEADFEDVHLSVFRNFPNLSFGLEHFYVEGIDEFSGIRLVEGESLELVLDLFSVLRQNDPIQLKSVEVIRPNVKVYVLEDGRANYDIVKVDTSTATEAPATGEESSFVVQLQSYSVEDGKVYYDDATVNTQVDIRQLNHQGSGNFTLDVFDLNTSTTIDSITITYDGIAYLSDAEAQLDAIFQVEQPQQKYTLKDNKLSVNQLGLTADGWVQLLKEGYEMDLSINAPENQFKHLFSIIPNAYTEGYEDVAVDGQFQLAGAVKGFYPLDGSTLPPFNFQLSVDGGDVQYPDLPLGINDVQTQANISSPSSDLDDMEIDVSRFNMKIGNNPIAASLRLRTPISDPDIAAQVDGRLNLQELSRAFPMEGVESLNGAITSDLRAKTKMSYIDKGQYERVDMAGNLQVEGLNYRSADLPPVQIKKARMNFSPQYVALQEFDALLGSSDLRATGRIDNILAYFSPQHSMKGALEVRSNKFDANEWISAATASPEPAPVAVSTESEGEPAATAAPAFDRYDFALDARLDQILYEDYDIRNTVAVGRLTADRLEIERASMEIGDSDVAASGALTNVVDYALAGETLGGELNIRSEYLDLNQFMVAETGETTEATPAGSPDDETASDLNPYVVPANIDLKINARANEVRYDNWRLKELNGALDIANQAVTLEDVQTQTLGGIMKLMGSYDTQDAANPAFNFKYDMESINFQEAFNTLNTFRILAPVGRFLEGKFNTSLIMDGTLTSDLLPNLSTLDAKGVLETVNAVVEGLEPLQRIGQKLRIKEFTERIQIQDSRNWFEVKDGAMELREFDVNVEEIPLTIGGTHNLGGGMDINIKASVPREKVEQSPVGAAAGTGMDFLRQQGSKLGLNIQQGDTYDFNINLTGSLTDPQLQFNLLGMDGKVSQDVSESLKGEAKDQLEEGKDQLRESAQSAVDSAKQRLKDQLQPGRDTARQPGESLKKAGESLKDSLKKKLIPGAKPDSTKTNSIDSIKKELEKFNPFKKKKKKGGGE